MKHLHLSFVLLGLLGLLACGGSSNAETDDSSGGEDTHDMSHHGDEHEYANHPEMAPALEEFHYAFSDHWHGDRSGAAVCPDMERMQGLANAAADEHEAADQSEALRATTQQVVDACAADPSGDAYTQGFDRMHHALHDMMGVPLQE